MIQAQVVILRDISFFCTFYNKSLQLLVDTSISVCQYVKQYLEQQEPVFTLSAKIVGHAMPSDIYVSEKQNKYSNVREHEISCAAVSMQCKTLSAVLHQNLKTLVSLRAESEGHFEYTIDQMALIHDISMHNFYHYHEVMGAMKSFMVGLQLIAQKHPSTLQYTIEVI